MKSCDFEEFMDSDTECIICPSLNKNGTCRNIKNCRFSHPKQGADRSDNSTSKVVSKLNNLNLQAARKPLSALRGCQIPIEEARKIVFPNGNSKSQKSKKSKANNNSETPAIYEPFWKKAQIDEALSNNLIKKGRLRIDKKNRKVAYVQCEGSAQDLFIPNFKAQNRALDGDIVYVQLMEGKELEEAQKNELNQRELKHNENQKRQEKVEISKKELSPFKNIEMSLDFAKIVSIASSEQYKRSIVGNLSLGYPVTGKIDKKKLWFKPVDSRLPFLVISAESVPSDVLFARDRSNTLFSAAIKFWSENSPFPNGRYIGKVGQIGQLDTESRALLISAGVEWEEFSDVVLDSLVPTPWSIPIEELTKREDLRKQRIFSIDPPTAKDLDDALSCRDMGDGTFEVGVHIADVSYFVKPGTPLDDEAFHRATSVYLPQRVIPMLPKLLCEELCSLNPGVDRLAFSVFWIFDQNANVINGPRFSRTIINSCAKLWYDHAQAVIENRDLQSVSKLEIAGGWTEEDLKKDIKQLHHFSSIMRKRRFDAGALTLNSIKLWFTLDDLGNPINTGMYNIKESNRLIEEFMLFANMAVAKRTAESFPNAALLRRHFPPNEKSLQNTLEALQIAGIVIDSKNSGTLNSSLNEIPNETVQLLSRLMLIKSMKRANYFCTGCVDIETFGHYALSVPLYTHFTSPIRRYCDLIVHRLLEATMNCDDSPFSTEKVENFALQCNNRQNAARDAQENTSKLFLNIYFAELQKKLQMPDGIVMLGFVNFVGSRSLDVLVPRFGIEGRVWIEDIIEEGKAVGAENNPETQELFVHWKNGNGQGNHIQKFKIFDSVKVIVKSIVDMSPTKMKLVLAAPEDKVVDLDFDYELPANYGTCVLPQVDGDI